MSRVSPNDVGKRVGTYPTRIPPGTHPQRQCRKAVGTFDGKLVGASVALVGLAVSTSDPWVGASVGVDVGSRVGESVNGSARSSTLRMVNMLLGKTVSRARSSSTKSMTDASDAGIGNITSTTGLASNAGASKTPRRPEGRATSRIEPAASAYSGMRSFVEKNRKASLYASRFQSV